MLAGGLFTDLFAIESNMRLTNGDTKNYSEDSRRNELAVIDLTDPEFDQVTAIPESILRHRRHDRAQEFAVPDRGPALLSGTHGWKMASEETGGRKHPARSRTRGPARRSSSKPVTACDRDERSRRDQRAAVEIIPKARQYIARNLARLRSARGAADFCLNRRLDQMARCVMQADPLLQALQRDACAEIHPREISSNGNP